MCEVRASFSHTSNPASFYFDRYGVSLTLSDHFFNRSFVFSRSYSQLAVNAFAKLKLAGLIGVYQVLHVKGIGFKVFYHLNNHSLYFSLGYTHLLRFSLPPSITVKVRKEYILLFSLDSLVLGTTVEQIRGLRRPDPYRGKGIRYRFQLIKFKSGKQRLLLMITFFGRQYSDTVRLSTVLRSQYGIGAKRIKLICIACGVSIASFVRELSSYQLEYLTKNLHETYILNSELSRLTSANLFKKFRSGSYVGMRLSQGLPCRGQRTHSNCRTAKKLRPKFDQTPY